MIIRKPVINTFERVGINYKDLQNSNQEVEVFNRFGGGSVKTTSLIAKCIAWVYQTSNDYEVGIRKVNLSDFDRVRYFIAEVDSDAYSICID